MIEDWLKDDKSDNTPLVIQADEGVGKKTLLVKWMEYHKQNKATVIFRLNYRNTKII